MLGLLSTFKSARPAFARSRGSNAGPIAIDLGSDAVRAAQVVGTPNGSALVACGSAEVAPHAADDFDAYIRQLPDLLREATAGPFSGKQVVLSLPSSRVYWATLRLPKLDTEHLSDAVKFEAADKLPIDTSRALLRHEVAGEVHTKDGPRLEVLVSAARRGDVEAVLAAVEKVKLEPTGLRAAPLAMRAGFERFYNRANDQTTTFACVDLGRRSSRVFVTRGNEMTFARPIDIGIESIYAAMAEAELCDLHEVKRRRSVVADPRPAEPKAPEGEGFAMLGAAMRRHEERPEADQGDATIARFATQLAGELTRCRQYHDATFASKPIERLVFFGGGAADQGLCREVAKRVGVAAQVGDFACRLTGDNTLPDGCNATAWSQALGLAAGVPALR